MDRTKPQIDALKDSQFALPIKRLFPIEDDEDMQMAYNCAHEYEDPQAVREGALKIAREQQLKIPEGWKDAKMSQVVKFGEIGTTAVKRADGWYERKGKYFELDKTFTDMNGNNFGVPSEKAAEVLPLFKPTPVNFKHDPELEPLLNHMFKTRPMIESLAVDGKDVIATYAIPSWFQEATEGVAIPTSSEWDMDSYIPVGGAYVMNPAVKDSIMMSEPVKAAFAAAEAAFKDYDTAERKEMSKKHEAMADGSYPIASEQDVKNAVHDFGRGGSKPDVKAHIIKRAKALGCMDALPDDWRKSSMMGKDDDDGDMDDLRGLNPDVQDMHDQLVARGAECPGCSMFSDAEKIEWSTAHTIAMMKPSHLRTLQKMHDACPKGHCTHYATMRKGYLHRYAAQTPASADVNKGKIMNPLERLVAFFKSLGKSDAEANTQATAAIAALADVTPTEPKKPETAPVSFAESPEYRALMANMESQLTLAKANESRIAQMQESLAERDKQIATLTAKNEADAATAAFEANKEKLEGFVVDGKITPAERDTYVKLAKDHPAAFASVLPTLDTRPVLLQFEVPTKRIEGEPGSPANELDRLTKEYMAAHPDATYKVAFGEVQKANPVLANRRFHAVVTNGKSAGGNN